MCYPKRPWIQSLYVRMFPFRNFLSRSIQSKAHSHLSVHFGAKTITKIEKKKSYYFLFKKDQKNKLKGQIVWRQNRDDEISQRESRLRISRAAIFVFSCSFPCYFKAKLSLTHRKFCIHMAAIEPTETMKCLFASKYKKEERKKKQVSGIFTMRKKKKV